MKDTNWRKAPSSVYVFNKGVFQLELISVIVFFLPKTHHSSNLCATYGLMQIHSFCCGRSVMPLRWGIDYFSTMGCHNGLWNECCWHLLFNWQPSHVHINQLFHHFFHKLASQIFFELFDKRSIHSKCLIFVLIRTKVFINSVLPAVRHVIQLVRHLPKCRRKLSTSSRCWDTSDVDRK